MSLPRRCPQCQQEGLASARVYLHPNGGRVTFRHASGKRCITTDLERAFLDMAKAGLVRYAEVG